MMHNKQIGFGIVGAGMIAHFHAKAIAGIKYARLIGVYSVPIEMAQKFAKEYNCYAYSTLDQMLKNPAIKVLCICTPSGLHLDPVLAGITAGKHCLIEKPLEITVERCDQIIDAAHQKGVAIGSVFPSRFYDASKKIKEAIESKRIGNLVLGDAYVKWYRSPEYYRSGSWRGTWKYDGGGALMNQGIHSVDLLQWYMGEVKSVQAVATNALHKSIEVEDTIVASLQFANKALGVIECSTATFPGTPKRIEVRGTEGSVVLEEDKLTDWSFREEKPEDQKIIDGYLAVSAAKGGASDPGGIDYRGHQKQIEDMIDAVENGKDPFITGEEGKKSVAIIEAIYMSAKRGQKINLQ